MKDRESSEMYLETIYILSQKSDTVRKIDISKYMGYAKPSITRGIQLLKERGMVTVDDNGSLLLTDTGKAEAQRIYERHTVLTKMFMSLGVDKETASDDACRMEHYISDTTFNAIKKHLEEHQ